MMTNLLKTAISFWILAVVFACQKTEPIPEWQKIPIEIALYEVSDTNVFNLLFGPRRPYALSRDGEAYVAFADDGVLSMWDPRTGRRIKKLPVSIPARDTKTYAMTRALGVGKDTSGKRLCAIDKADSNGAYNLFILPEREVGWDITHSFNTSSNRSIEADITFGSRSVAYAGYDYLEIMNLQSSSVVRISNLPEGVHGSSKPWPIVFAPEDKFVAFGQKNTTIAVFDLYQQKQKLTFRFSADLQGPAYPITMLDVSPSGKLLAGGPSPYLCLFSVESGKWIRTVKNVRLARFLTEDILLTVGGSDTDKGTDIFAIDLKMPGDTGTMLLKLEGERISGIGIDTEDNLVVVPSGSRTYFYVLPGITRLARDKLAKR